MGALSILASILTAVLLIAPPAASAADDSINWARHTSQSCSTGEVFSCGSRGFYSVENPLAPSTFGSQEKGLESVPCSPAAGGDEVPMAYAGTPMAPASGTPCDDGSCISNGPGAGPWVAVIDWNQWHGETVSWMIGEIGTDADVVLFPLDGGVTASLQPSATDLQVLEQLCRVLEASEQQSAPVAVNMSFGRPNDLTPCGSSGDSLRCEISQVLDTLYDRGSWLVAAAGNHRRALFPGTHPLVMSVGSLDEKTLRYQDQAVPAWQSPAADALMPSDSICMADGSGHWGPPPGSSFAAALMTSWLTASRLPQGDPAIGGWAPFEHYENGERHYVLGHALGVLPQTRVAAIDSLFANMLSSDPIGCHPPNFYSNAVPVDMVPRTGAPPALPLVDYRPTSSGPTPDPDPCIPCTGGWDDGPGGGLTAGPMSLGLGAEKGAEKSAEKDLGRGAGKLLVYGSQRLAVSFMDSPGVAEGLRLVDVLIVRTRGDLYFEMDLSETERQALIDDIVAGNIEALAFGGLQLHLEPGDSVSVVYLFEPGPVTESRALQAPEPELELEATFERYWSSTPIREVTMHWPT